MVRLKGVVGPSYTLSTIPLDCQRTINLYVEPDEMQTGKDGSIGVLVCRPDLTKVLTLPQAPVRGLWRVSSTGQVFAVGGNGLYEIKSDWSATLVGRLNTDSGSISMSDNGIELIVVDGIYGWIVTLATGIMQLITAPAFYSSKKVIYIDTYFVLVRPNSQQIYQSETYDGLTYGALNFTPVQASPDLTVTVLPYRDQIVAFGERTTQFYVDSANPSFAFDNVQGALIEHGCAAALSPAKDGDTLVWLGEDEYGNGVVYKAVGYQAARASNYGVELAIQGYSTISDATGFMFQMRGHTFYVLSFPSANTSWILDVGLGTWSEWTSTKADGSQGAWRAWVHLWAFGKHIVGDFEDGRIYTLGFSNRTDDGKVIQRRRRIPPVSNNLKRLIHSKFQLDCRTGIGTDGTDQGQQPTVMLRYSDDGGISWSSEKWAQLGRVGQTQARVIWRMLGQSRNRVYEITVTDPVDVAIMGADLDAQPCAS